MAMRFITHLIAVIGLLYIATGGSIAHAYLDPGTGSYLFQIILAGVFGGLAAVKIFWGKIRSLFGKRKNQQSDSSEPENKNE